MENKIICGIYKITSPSGKVYIGQSKNVRKRFNKYNKKDCESQTRLLRSFNKYTFKKHTFEIIEECLFEYLNCRERFWQDFYDVTGKNGLNCILTECGDLKQEVSIETRKRMRDSRIGKTHSKETIEKLKTAQLGEKHHNYGKSPSKETRLKQSKSTKGISNKGAFKKGSIPTTAKKVIDTITLQIFNSVKEAADYIGMKHATLKSQLNGTNKNKTNLLLLEDYNKLKNE